MTDTGTTANQVPPNIRSLKRAHLWYCIGFVCLETLALILTFSATTTPWFLEHDGYPSLRLMGYSLRSQGKACDVLLYGDSTALAGLDPSIIHAKTGLSACNISEYRPVEEFEGVDYFLDQYLAGNPAPRYLVTSWVASNFQIEHPRMMTTRFEGFTFALQYDRGGWLWKGMLSKPYETAAYLTLAEGAIITDAAERIIHHAAHHQDERARREAHDGMWSFPGKPQTTCGTSDTPSLTNHDQNIVGVSTFRKRYEVSGTRVIINVSPAANCDTDLQKYRALTAGLTDNQLEVLPVSNFVSFNAHLTPAAAANYSSRVADRILADMAKDGTSTRGERVR